MTLETGTRLGPFEIQEPLGAGGMGEVYRARDTKLQRDVAIKLLNKEFAEDPERSARFQREAKVVAALNHPHIGGIYGFEETDGVRYLILELVQGQTLAERLEGGPLLLRDALEFCLQIAEALEQAHENGIIHRDLKPANVKIAPNGKVKILDFGLAKAFEEETPDDQSKSPTITLNHTRPGIILGSAAYMSPEQARGKSIDKRTDIWAFGCLLFEVLTGARAFEGETTSDTIAKILEREPNFDLLPAATPHNVRRLMERCLEKDRRRRLRDIGDAALEIEQALSVLSGPRKLEDTGPRPRPQVGSVLRFLGLLIVGVLAGAALWNLIHPGRDRVLGPADTLRLSVIVPTEPEYTRGAISPDGRMIVFSADDYTAGDGTPVREQLYIRPLDDFAARPIPGTEGALAPTFSPDGKWIAFFAWDDLGRSRGKIKKVSVDGGPPVTLRDGIRGAELAVWASNDSLLVISERGTSLGMLPSDGGTLRKLQDFELGSGEGGIAWAEALPDGEAALVTVLNLGQEGPRSYIELVSLDTGARTTFLDNAGFPQYSSTGHLAFSRDDALLVVPFDLRSHRITGSVVPVMSGLRASFRGFSSSDFDLSSNGHLMYVPGTESFEDRRLFMVDREGNSRQLTRASRSFEGYLRFSPDGEKLAMVITGADGLPIVWTLDVERGLLRPISMSGSPCYFPVWSPDGKEIAYSQWIDTRQSAIYVTRADGSGQARELLVSDPDEFGILPMSWAPDGSVLAYERRREGAQDSDIWLLPLEGDATPRGLIASPTVREGWASFSPDGRWIAYVSNESGRDEVYVQEYGGIDAPLGAKWPVSSGGGTRPFWSADGREIFFEDMQERLLSATVTLDSTFSVSQPGVVLRGKQLNATGSGDRFHIAPDGDHFVYVQKGLDEGEVTQIDVVLNWAEEMKRRVPVQ